MAYSDVLALLQAIRPDWKATAIFATDDGNEYWPVFRGLDGLSEKLGCYMSLATYPNDGSAERTAAHALGSSLLVIDDVGAGDPAKQHKPETVRLMLGKPHARVLTSAGNEQWWYRLSRMVPKGDEWHRFVGGVEALLGKGLDDGGRIIQHFRMPMGLNLKPGRGRFKVRLVECDAKVPDLDVDTIKPVQRARASGAKGGSAIPLTTKAWGELLGMIPNVAVGRDEWVNIGQRSKARLEDPDDPVAEDIFVGWTTGGDSWGSGKHDDEGYVREKWKGFSGTGTEGFLLDKAAEMADPGGYAAWSSGVTRPGAAAAFDDGLVTPNPTVGPPGRAPGPITATPYGWVEPDKIPPRDWLYGRLLIRKFISMTVAPGGVGKSSLVAVETLAQVCGRDLLGEKPSGALKVWLWNLEDPAEETTRKIQAAAKHYGLGEGDLGGRLFVDSGRDQKLVMAQMGDRGPMIVRPVVGALVGEIQRRGIDVVVIDPFVSCHSVPENDNMAQDMVVKEWGRVAEEGGCAVHLVDHTRKAGAGVEVGTESARGAKAKTDAARVVRVVNRMTETQGKTYGVMEPWRYFNTFNDKSNMAPPAGVRDWFHLESVGLGNGGGAGAAFAVGAGVVHGDDVGVATRWVPPSPQALVTGANFKAMVDAMEGKEWRKDAQTGDKWIGNAAAEALNLDPKNAKDRKDMKEVLETWFKAGLLKEVERLDEKRRPRIFIEIAGGF